MPGHPPSSANGQCPVCAMPVPFMVAAFRRSKPFACGGCQRLLRTGKTSVGLAVAGFALASLLGKQFGFVAVLGVLVLLALYEWLTVRVTPADSQEQRAGDLE